MRKIVNKVPVVVPEQLPLGEGTVLNADGSIADIF
jgi:hypothetical protein